MRNVTDVFVKTNTVAKCGWTTQPCAREDGTALLVQVEGSAIDLYLDVTGAHLKWALDMSGAQIELGLGNWA